MQSLKIVGEHPIIRKVARLAERLATTGHPVLISGEQGTGRQLLAAVLHARGPRAAAPFIVFDCRRAACDAGRRGAELRAAVEAARHGSLFLKDVEWLDEGAQLQLLAALAPQREAAVRLVMSCAAARSAQLEMFPAVARRLGALELFLPPLRERRCDIPALVEHFLAEQPAAGGRARLDDAAALALWRYDWPGNVRQLREEVERAVERCCGDRLGCECFSASVCGQDGGAAVRHARPARDGVPLRHFAPQWGSLRVG